MNGVMSPYINQPSPTAREILGICFEILNIQQKKLWKILTSVVGIGFFF